MSTALKMPKLSDTMAEATISRWLKGLGDEVAKGEPVVEVETDKVIVEVEAPEAGVIVEIVVQEQESVNVDGVICRIGQAGEAPAAGAAASSPPGEASPEAAAAPTPAAPAVAVPAAAPAAAAAPPSNVVPLVQRAAQAPALADAGDVTGVSPLARRVAQELGIDLRTVQGTGIGGKIVLSDLDGYLPAGSAATALAAPPAWTRPASAGNSAAASAQASAPAPLAAGDGSLAQPTTERHSPLRRTIAQRMAQSKREIPHFYMSTEVDVTEALAWRKRLNEVLEAEQRISVNDVMLKACALTLEAMPQLNAAWSEEGVLRYTSVNLAFAVAIEEGLVTPVLRDCQLKSVGRIAKESRVLIEKAKARSLASEDLNGGTFTLSNLGMFDVTEFSAIINPPQVAILAVPKPVERPVVRQGRVEPRAMLTLTLSCDHRAIDGATSARFLEALKALLEHPERLAL